jgi:hypothetical protein
LQPSKADGRHRLDCVWAERLPLNTPYHKIITRLDQHRQHVGKSVIVLDETGVGRPVVEQAKAKIRGARVIGLTITGGMSVNGWRVPKRHLITNLQILSQAGILKISEGIPEVDLKALVDELKNYKVEITQNARESYGPWREGEHDDMVLALAIAGFAAVRMLRLVVPKDI